MTKKILAIVAAVVVLVGGGSFYGGMKYAQSKTPQRNGQFGGANITGGFQGSRNGTNGGFTAGDIITMDNNSITIKMRDGSSKIVFYSSTTEVSKFTSGTSSDLAVGKSVNVTGQTNSDGSITAQSIQIRPIPANLPTPTQ